MFLEDVGRDERQVVNGLSEFRGHASCSNGHEANSGYGGGNLRRAIGPPGILRYRLICADIVEKVHGHAGGLSRPEASCFRTLPGRIEDANDERDRRARRAGGRLQYGRLEPMVLDVRTERDRVRCHCHRLGKPGEDCRDNREPKDGAGASKVH
jgi:hypothetical protein